MAAYAREYRKTFPTKIRSLNEHYYAENRASVLTQKQTYYSINRETVRRKTKARFDRIKQTPEFKSDTADRSLRRKFGISLEDYEQMLQSQDRKCKICGKASQNKNARLSVDHCHKTGRIRGLLCNPCNSFLGRIDDDPDKLEAVKQYLLG